MKKQGFTLVELIGVIVILGLIVSFSVPALTKTMKDSSEKQYENYVKDIILAAENYFHSETDGVLEGKYFIKIGTLVEKGYLKKTVNPKTNEVTSEEATVIISRNEDSTEKYDFVELDVTAEGYVKDGLILLYDGYNRPIDSIWEDLSGNDNDGTINGYNDSDNWNNGGIYFDGTNTWINTPINSINDEITIEIVLNIPAIVSKEEYILNFSPTTPAYSYTGLRLLTSGIMNVESYGKIGLTSVDYNKYINHNWLFSIVAKKNSNSQFFTDGMLELDYTSGNSEIGNVNLVIGDLRPNRQIRFTGTIYSVRIYNRALTGTEIKNNYNVDKYRFDI